MLVCKKSLGTPPGEKDVSGWQSASTPIFQDRWDTVYTEISMVQQQFSQPEPWARKRRSQRLTLSVAVIAYRLSKHGAPFYEGTHTLVVSAHGALINLAAKVATDQRLILKNALSGQEQACRIVFRKKKLFGPTEVGIEFQQPAPKFWRVAFPPPDWNLAR